jgi:hypothetical protein
LVSITGVVHKCTGANGRVSFLDSSGDNGTDKNYSSFRCDSDQRIVHDELISIVYC